ncbi:MAG TPA: hypothetical protein VN823_21785 [Stellaceae bacterium]|nr:hypothetical protein [Stellaceae bacterium]
MGRGTPRALGGVPRFVGLCLLLSFLAACVSEDAPPITGRRVAIPDASISVSLPDGVSVLGRQDRPGITTYGFSRDDQVFMGLYVGLTPSFHPAKDEAGIETETVGGMPAQTRVVKSPDGAWSRDIVVELASHRFCHFFYRDLHEPDLLLADHIIGSLHDGP